MMDESTPKNITPKFRHAPTPKLSERKKKLFDENGSKPSIANAIIAEEEDSDLGPMSPLQFSSSPSSFNKTISSSAADYVIDKKQKARTDFKNILTESDSLMATPIHRSSLKEINCSENIDVATNIIDSPVTSKGTALDTNDDDSFFEKENYAKQMKTPNELGSMTNCNEPLFRGLSFRKSLIFDSGLTPNDDNVSTNKSNDLNESATASGEHPKAKTSLIFTEPLISAKSFYGSKNSTPSIDYVKRKVDTSRVAYAPTKQFKISSKISAMTTKKINARKRHGPTLWRHAGAIKKLRKQIIKPVKKMSKSQWVKTALTELNKQYPDEEKNERKRIEAIAKAIKTPETSEDMAIRAEQLKRIQQSLQSRPQSTADENDSFENSDDEDDDHENNQQILKAAATNTDETNDQVATSRKFFKSSGGSTTKKYRIMGGISATLKRGCDLKLERPVKRVKRQKRQETVVLHNEITSIIDRLSSPQKNKHSNQISNNNPSASNLESLNVSLMATDESIIAGVVNSEQLDVDPSKKYRDMVPYQTNDPTKISQQESILELLISNGICDERTFKVFIAEPDLHRDEATTILNNLYCVGGMLPDDADDGDWSPVADDIAPTDTNISTVDVLNTEYVEDVPMSPASQISNMTSTLAIECSSELIKDNEQNSTNYFPIFNRDAAKPKQSKTLFNSINNTNKKWKTIGDRQYQIDAGQKEFGIKTCAQCEMQYSAHEPEDEILHEKYHKAINILSFKGWSNERLIMNMPEWGIRGRIILICETDSKSKKIRVKDILSVVDRDLGFAAQTMAPKTVVYLGIAKNQIIGVCVAQPLSEAHRLVNENGLDCCTKDTFQVRCGVSRIWVAPPYRGFGVASSMVSALRTNFVFGSYLTFDQIAFSSPTEAGKKLAAKLTQRADFLVFER